MAIQNNIFSSVLDGGGYNSKQEVASSTLNLDNENAAVASFLVGSKRWMKMKEFVFEARRARVKDVCATFDPINRWREIEQGKRRFWFDLKHGFAFCAQPKVCYFMSNILIKFQFC